MNSLRAIFSQGSSYCEQARSAFVKQMEQNYPNYNELPIGIPVAAMRSFAWTSVTVLILTRIKGDHFSHAFRFGAMASIGSVVDSAVRTYINRIIPAPKKEIHSEDEMVEVDPVKDCDEPEESKASPKTDNAVPKNIALQRAILRNVIIVGTLHVLNDYFSSSPKSGHGFYSAALLSGRIFFNTALLLGITAYQTNQTFSDKKANTWVLV